MVHAATWLVRHLRKDLRELAEQYPDYRLVATGHSLGAAVAALSAMQLRHEFPNIHCYAFGTPACVTQELADESYDLVTSVVNGYDCVPRLHQHSLLKLQDEIRRFDWRAALRQMVADEIRKQKLAVEKQQRAKLEELQAALRKIDGLQLKQRTSEATAKLDEVKKFASTNIKEFANDVDTLVADKLDAAFSIFKTDKLSLEHVTFIKNLLKLEDIKKGIEVHAYANATQERRRIWYVVSRSGAKTCWLHRYLMEFLHEDAIAESTQLQLFRSRINGIIDKTRESLKTRISEQVYVFSALPFDCTCSYTELNCSLIFHRSKVSTAVTSNVKDYVDTIKEETEAFSTIVQEEMDDVADAISRNLPFVVGLNDKNAEDAQSPAQSATLKKEKHRHEVFADADPSERIEGESNEEGEQQWEKLKQEQRQWEDDNMLRHDPLFPPGRILYLNRVVAPGPSLQSSSVVDNNADTHKVPDIIEFVEVATDDFGRVVLSNRMLLDHLCTDYERVLQSQAKLLEPVSSST
ncbi:unnamed protein product [Phytophthora lilii]|uniref:Unnamed protein product n=1 Tax=Phytophthora lilii TaxID=2077276 RepID=A0A9W6WRN7_9STRA|nr:unnamed protein product [Phytophthora lilii]